MDIIFLLVLEIRKDTFQTTLKRKRVCNRDHMEVQHYQLKYSHVCSNHPVKKNNKLMSLLVEADKNRYLLDIIIFVLF